MLCKPSRGPTSLMRMSMPCFLLDRMLQCWIEFYDSAEGVSMARYPSKAPERSSVEAGGVAAVDRALSLLAAYQEGDRSLTLNDLAARSGLVKSTILRLLASLAHFGFVRRDQEGRYT